MPDSIDYGAVLADLKAKRAALDQTIAGLEAVLAGTGVAETGPIGNGVKAAIHVDSFVGMNIPDATAQYLRMVGRPARSTEEIINALASGGLRATDDSVRTVLSRTSRGGGEVLRVGRGTWGLAEWYPGRVRRGTRRSTAEEAEAGSESEGESKSS